MEARVSMRLVFVALAALFLLPAFSFAQTNVTDTIVDTVGGIVQGEFDSQTGLDKVKEVKDISAGDLADKTVEYIVGDTPSVLMTNLINQLLEENSFKLWTVKDQKKDVPWHTRDSCQRIANGKLWEGLLNASAKGHFAPWVDIAWTAVKSIADGGKSIGEMIADNTKAKVEALIKDALIGKAEPKVEVVTIPHHDSCNTITKITWDPVNKRIIVVTTGDCQCKLISSKWTGDSARLKDFVVILEASVEIVNVRINERTRFGGYLGEWVGKTYDIQAQYKVGKLHVTTKDDCDCAGYVPPEEKGFVTGIFEWLEGLFDPPTEPEDQSDSPKDTEGGTDDEGATEEGEEPPSTGLGGFLGGLFSGDKTDEPEDQIDDDSTEDETDDTKDAEGNTKKPLQCGDTTSIEGKSVETFPYRETPSSNVNFACNNSCGADQVCSVLPESVGAYSDSCVYCKDVPKVNSKPTDAPPVATGGSCEKAVRLLLDEYNGWFDPPITFSANGAVLFHEHRCFPEADYDTHTRQLTIQGVADAKFKSMCPSLKHVSSVMTRITQGSKGLCSSKTIFSF